MNKICVICGKPFESKTDRAKYCSKVCANHSRFRRTREQIAKDTEAQRLKVFELYLTGLNDREIAKAIGICIAKVAELRRELNLPKQMTKLQRKVYDLRKQGKCGYEISSEMGISSNQVAALAKKVGLPYTEEERRRSLSLSQCSDEEHFFAEHHPDWEHIAGHHGGNDMMTIRHRICGSVIDKSAITIRKARTLKCPTCEKRKNELRQIERKERRAQIEQKKIEKFWSQNFEQSTFSFKKCEECGLFFIGQTKFCSEECRKRRANRIHDKRLEKVACIDKDITLKKLFKRDAGVCWICGEPCDYNDYHLDDCGHFVVGKRYPSIDHVYPVSKGGVHSWDNVKLAHHYCNTLKNDRVV